MNPRGLMVDHETVKQLAQLRDELAISILCPLNTRRPRKSHDSAVLRKLRDGTVDKIGALLQGPAAASLIARVPAGCLADLAHVALLTRY